MAIVNLYQQADMANTYVWYGNVTSYSSNHISLASYPYSATYYGTFTYSSYGLSGGTVTGYKQWVYGTLSYEVSGVNVSALTLKYYLDTGDATAVQKYVLAYNDTLNGSPYNDKLIGWSGNDIIKGFGGNDSLYGYDGNDTLDGGAGNDYMAGGVGNDTYILNATGDVISEAAGAGLDRVNAYVSYTLGANVENLYLLGAAVSGTGNNLNNTIVGNSNANSMSGLAGNDSLYGYGGNDTLNGGTGNDYMVGGVGNDTYSVDAAGDIVSEAAGAGLDRVNAYVSYTLGANVENLYLFGAAIYGTGNGLDNIIVGNSSANRLYGLEGNDSLNGGDGNDSLYGYVGNDSLVGSNGNDTLNGGPGNDNMAGGTGNDTYYVDTPGDVVSEATGAGIDRVNAYVSHSLGANVENLYLYGSAIYGSGNGLDNIIGGNSGANRLYGLEGNDTLNGAGGNDSLYGYHGNDTLIGGAGNDYLAGGLGNDTLYGGTGNDTLYGGPGRDRFVFTESGPANRDAIPDFSHLDDTIVLKDILDGVSNAAIKGLTFTAGVLNTYFEGAGYTGNNLGDASGIYNNTTTGVISYNPTSTVANDAVHICTVGVATAASLDHTDFVYSA